MSSVASQANYELADATLTHIQASSAAVQVEQAEAKAIAVTTQAIKAKTAARRELSESEWRAYEQEQLIGKTAEEIEAYEREHGVVTPVWEETT
ncbi:MAG: hypothetical protein QXF26_05440, partial [Candidatus Bathyarchaeia archaeon]